MTIYNMNADGTPKIEHGIPEDLRDEYAGYCEDAKKDPPTTEETPTFLMGLVERIAQLTAERKLETDRSDLLDKELAAVLVECRELRAERDELKKARDLFARGLEAEEKDCEELHDQVDRLEAELSRLKALPEQFREQCGDHCNNWCWHEKAAEFVESIANRSKPPEENL